MSKILITGSAGFIGSSLVYDLLDSDYDIIAVDNLNDYYDIDLKNSRLERIKKKVEEKNLAPERYKFHKLDLVDLNALDILINDSEPEVICHLAAQAGVRYSIENPHTYVENNITATLNLLECSKNYDINNFVFASTSSVYGLNEDTPFNENLKIDSTISTYSTTKRACELLCHTYHDLYSIKFKILRFFTVYGPWGRPDMALFKFTKAILENKPIDVYNKGNMIRDFTYIDDIIQGFKKAIESDFDFEIFNLGNGKQVPLIEFIEIIEENLGKKSIRNLLPMQKGDVSTTMADISKAKELLGYRPTVNVESGICNFIDWYKKYYV